MTNSRTVRPRLHTKDLDTISAALQVHIDQLQAKVDKHKDSGTRFKEDGQDEWLQRNERLTWKLTCAKVAKKKIDGNLKGVTDRSQQALSRLLTVTKEDKVGQYLTFLQALKFIPKSGDLDTDIHLLLNACDQGTVRSYRDPDQDGLRMIRKIDAMRLGAFLEAHE